MTFQMPEGFVAAEITENNELNFNPSTMMMADEFVVKHPEKRLEIRYTIRPLDNLLQEYEEREQSGLHPNELHSAAFMAMVFNISGAFSQVSVLPQAEQQRVNADWGAATFVSPSRERFGQDFFRYCMMIAIHKAYVADVYFFFLGDNRGDVVELVRNTFHYLRFKEDSNDDTPHLPLCQENDEGVIISGVRWATRNVDAPGTFTSNPEDAGMHFQWNRRKGWNVASDFTSWDNSMPLGTTAWETANNPCPTGWRIPTQTEFESLNNVNNVWTTHNGISGRLFGTAPNQIFLPAAGFRYGGDGVHHHAGSGGLYWSSAQGYSGELARSQVIGSAGTQMHWFDRTVGGSIRCVAKEP